MSTPAVSTASARTLCGSLFHNFLEYVSCNIVEALPPIFRLCGKTEVAFFSNTSLGFGGLIPLPASPGKQSPLDDVEFSFAGTAERS